MLELLLEKVLILDQLASLVAAVKAKLGIGDAGEGATVERRDALLVDRGAVLGGRVADVFVEAPAGMALGGLTHVAVAGDLGEDRGGGDGGACAVPADHAAVRDLAAGQAEAVDEADRLGAGLDARQGV